MPAAEVIPGMDLPGTLRVCSARIARDKKVTQIETATACQPTKKSSSQATSAKMTLLRDYFRNNDFAQLHVKFNHGQMPPVYRRHRVILICRSKSPNPQILRSDTTPSNPYP